MGNMKNNFYSNVYKSPFEQANTRKKHLWSQVKGETQQTQNQIILEHQTRKQS
ncbi:hypothetical protein GCM10008967_35000 [Bacillus carboniphilus]|uniref:YpzG family protein n=1 Tax=Bacillus carboniphilus TaxID=86663 RepID=A0ABP3GF97_9BACI